MRLPIKICIVKPHDARGWIGLGCFLLVLVVLAMIAIDKSLLDHDAFLILATAVVITGWVNGPVGWAYQATKSGGELAESSARIAEQAATSAVGIADRSSGGAVEDMKVDAENVTVTGKGK
jgi:hypothetical protein